MSASHRSRSKADLTGSRLYTSAGARLGFVPWGPGVAVYIDRSRGFFMSVLEVGDHVGDFALPGGVLGSSGFERRSYMLCRQRGNSLLLTFDSECDSSAYTRRLMDRAERVGCCRPGNWAFWAISPHSMDSQEECARRHGLTMPMLSDPNCTVARSFGVIPPNGGIRSSVFLIAPNRTLLWKHVSVHEPLRHLPWDLMQSLVEKRQRTPPSSPS